MRCIGNHRAGDPRALPQYGDNPRNRPAPIVADNGERPDPQRICQLKHIACQLVWPVGAHLLRFRRATIAALVRRDAAEMAREMRDLVPPATVAFGKAVQENQRGGVARTFIETI
jgi:hypothetical protein